MTSSYTNNYDYSYESNNQPITVRPYVREIWPLLELYVAPGMAASTHPGHMRIVDMVMLEMVGVKVKIKRWEEKLLTTKTPPLVGKK